MIVSHSRNFKKMFKRCPAFLQNNFEERVLLFMEDTHHPLLKNHSLNGEWKGYSSINITGDFRAVFQEINDEHIEFVAIGTHSELYS